jgi:predicted MFS family arabinose efflux permease
MAPLTGRALVAAMCLGQVGNLLPHVVVPAVMAQHLMPLWGLTAAQAGLMASGYTFGYMLAVPLLTTLTDRIDARHILAAGSTLSGLATVMFGLIANGLWSATLIWAIAGIGFAGAYMPGLKALADRLPAGDVSRSVTLYTSSFSIGVGLSFLVAQLVADNSGWRAAFYVTGAGPLMMLAVCLGLAPHKPPAAPGHLLDLRPVLRNRPALGYILGYGAHSFELYGMRTWLVAFWAFVVAQSEGAAPIGPITVSVIVTLLSLPASVLGNEAALRYGRHRAITAVMIASAAVALAIGFSVGAPPLLLLPIVLIYGLTVSADYVRDDCERGANATWRDVGVTFDGWIWSCRARRLGRRRCTRRRRRASQGIRLARTVRAAGGRNSSRSGRFMVVAAWQVMRPTMSIYGARRTQSGPHPPAKTVSPASGLSTARCTVHRETGVIRVWAASISFWP